MALYSAAGANFDLWAKKQALKFSVSLVLLFIIAFIDMRIWFKYAYQIFFLSLLLLFSVEIFGTFGLGAKRWIKIFNISIQPSELIKVTLILFLAKYYQNLRYDRIHLKMELIIPVIGVIFSRYKNLEIYSLIYYWNNFDAYNVDICSKRLSKT